MFFPGSTIGNLSRVHAAALLSTMAERMRGGALLLGVDICKDAAVLHAAYNDSRGVTAAFNRTSSPGSIASSTPTSSSTPSSTTPFTIEEHARIEMRLVSREPGRDVGGVAFFPQGRVHHLRALAQVHAGGLARMARAAGWQFGHCWIDDDARFSVSTSARADDARVSGAATNLVLKRRDCIPAATDDVLAGGFDDAARDGIARIAARLRRQVILTFVHDDDLAEEGRVAAELRVAQHLLHHARSVGRDIAEIAEMARGRTRVRRTMGSVLRVQMLTGRRAIGARMDVQAMRSGIDAHEHDVDRQRPVPPAAVWNSTIPRAVLSPRGCTSARAMSRGVSPAAPRRRGPRGS